MGPFVLLAPFMLVYGPNWLSWQWPSQAGVSCKVYHSQGAHYKPQWASYPNQIPENDCQKAMNSDSNQFFTVTASATVSGLGTNYHPFDFGAHESLGGHQHWMHPSYRRYVGTQFGSSSTTVGTYPYNPSPPYIDFVFDLTGANQYVSGFRQMTHKDIIWHVRE